MSVNFSEDPSATGFFAPTRYEADVFDCEVQGQIPKELNGAFYRACVDWLYPSKDPIHDAVPFNGDGYIGMFRIANGNCDYKGRYVRTDRYLADRKARKQLFGMYRNRSTDDPSVRNLSGTVANTSPYSHGGKFFALKEDSLPIEMDPNTLETIGPWDFHGKYRSKTFTAHPKIDPVTGEMICYGYEASGDLSNDVFVYWIDKSGHVSREVRFKTPIVSMMHDIAVSEKHIVFNTCGFIANEELLKAGKVHWAWDYNAPTYVAILPRDGDAKDIRWFKGPQSAAIHFLNAITKDNKVIVDTPVSDGNPFPFFPQLDGSRWDPQKAFTAFRRWTFDLNSNKETWEEEKLFQQAPGALCRMDERYLTLPHRYAFMGFADRSRPFDEKRAGNFGGRVTNCYGRFDFHSNEIKSYFAGDVHSLHESQFVPKQKQGEEGDGYVVGCVNNYAEMHSELVIVDAPTMEEVTRVILPFRLPTQVHGWWADADQLGLAAPA